MPRTLPRLLLALAASMGAGAHAATTISTDAPPAYGKSVEVRVSESDSPLYLPATRYARTGNDIVMDVEVVSGNAQATPALSKQATVALGELLPGAYVVNARVHDIANPGADPQLVQSRFDVAPPAEWGIFAIPQQPEARSAMHALVTSAAYIDPAATRLTVSGDVIRVDFDFYSDAPVTRSGPPGSVPYVAVELPRLAAGAYRMEGWGRAKNGGTPALYFTREVSVAPTVTVTEYYAPTTDHYFMSAWADEVDLLDRGGQGAWQRTGQRFKAWLTQAEAPLHARPVCRFYARAPNSHFYTGDPAECDYLKSLEADGRAQAAARGETFMGWQFEAIAFYALVPQNGACPSGTTPVYRAYNNRAQDNDTNHRFTPDEKVRAAMAVSWIDEGVAFCSPS